MARKKTEKNITLDDLAVMVNSGFQSMRDEMNERFEGLEGEMSEMNERFVSLEEETRDGFRDVNMKIERIARIDEHQDSEVFELKGRVKVIEKKLGIKTPRT